MITMERSAQVEVSHPTGGMDKDWRIELRTPKPSSKIHFQRFAAGIVGITKWQQVKHLEEAFRPGDLI